MRAGRNGKRHALTEARSIQAAALELWTADKATGALPPRLKHGFESRWGHHLILAHLRRVDFHPLPVGAQYPRRVSRRPVVVPNNHATLALRWSAYSRTGRKQWNHSRCRTIRSASKCTPREESCDGNRTPRIQGARPFCRGSTVIRVNRISLTPSGKFAPVVIESIGLVFLLIRTAEWQPLDLHKSSPRKLSTATPRR